MSDYIFAVFIPIVAIAITYAWVPLLNLVCPPCDRFSNRIGLEPDELKRNLR